MSSIITLFLWGLVNIIATNWLCSFLALGDVAHLATALEASLIQTSGSAAISVFVVAVIAALGHFDDSVTTDRVRFVAEGRNKSSTLVPFFDFAVLASFSQFAVITLLSFLDDVVPTERTQTWLT